MADFALWATAAEPALGFAPGEFIAAYWANRESGNEVALEASPVGKAVIDFVAEVGEWTGTSTELLGELEPRVDEATKRQKTWPATARPLGGAVKRLAPNLREAGIDVDFTRKGKRSARLIVLRGRPEQPCNFASASSIASASDKSSGFLGLEADAIADANSTADANGIHFTSDSAIAFHDEYSEVDANDMADANMRLCSDWHNEDSEHNDGDSSMQFP